MKIDREIHCVMWSLFVRLLLSSSYTIVHFLVALSLCFKEKLSAKPVKWKLFFILMQIKHIITRKVLHLASYWKWGLLEIEMAYFMLFSSKCCWQIFRYFKSNTAINKHWQFQSWLISRFIETVLGKMMILFFQRLIGHWVLLHLNLTHIIFVHYLLMQASPKFAYSKHLYANAVVLMFSVSWRVA